MVKKNLFIGEKSSQKASPKIFWVDKNNIVEVGSKEAKTDKWGIYSYGIKVVKLSELKEEIENMINWCEVDKKNFSNTFKINKDEYSSDRVKESEYAIEVLKELKNNLGIE